MSVIMNHAQCVDIHGSQYNIGKMIAAGKLFKIEPGIYSESEHVPEIAILAFKYPKAVVTMHSAFYMHGLTDVIPEGYDFATDRDAAKISDKRVNQYFYPKETLLDGIEKINHRGYEIQIYSKERMLVELIRYKNKLAFDYYKEIILNYRKLMPHLNIQAIQDFVMSSPKSDMIMEVLQLEVF